MQIEITISKKFSSDGNKKTFQKTKDFLNVLENLNLKDKKSLFVFADANNNVYLSSRNLKGSDVVICSELSTYKILNANQLVLLESSLNEIKTNLSK